MSPPDCGFAHLSLVGSGPDQQQVRNIVTGPT